LVIHAPDGPTKVRQTGAFRQGTPFAPRTGQEDAMLWLIALVFGGVAFAFVKVRRRRKGASQV
jgi:LPXTG-motif cell wall-anchored protein